MTQESVMNHASPHRPLAGLLLACLVATTGQPPVVAAAAAPRGALSVIEAVGVGVGPIPDGPGPACGPAGPFLTVTFEVPPFVGRLVDIQLSMGFQPAHTWAGDVTAQLINPVGTIHTLFGRVGATTATGCGDASDLVGPYLFDDDATPASGGFWQAATAAGMTAPILLGGYRTSESGGAGAVNPAPPTSLRAAFAGALGSTSTTTWTLRLRDHGEGDTGTLAQATLLLYVDETIFRSGFEAAAPP
jgi:hypothetical protein